MHILRQVAKVVAGLSLAMVCFSCVEKNYTLGGDYLATNQQYDIYTAELPIEDIRMETADSLSGFSMYRFTFGSVRDEQYGLTTRSTAFTLVPISDTLDFGKAGTQVFRQFHFSAVSDSTSFNDPTQATILQNVYVYELKTRLNMDSSEPKVEYYPERITDGIPIYNGFDSLSFNFSRAFGEKYMKINYKTDLDTITSYTAKFPGIYITTDTPLGYGGRINMFKLPINVVSSTISGSYAELKFTADYERSNGTVASVDTSFIFYLGPVNIRDMENVTSTSVSEYPQIAYDWTTHETKELAGAATDKVYFEGGRGLKPVIKAESLRKSLIEEVSKHGDPSKTVITRATLCLPFDFPEDYKMMDLYPTIMSPTSRIVRTNGKVSFAGLTDAAVSSENQGDINRSLGQYAPDISHHAQEVMRLDDISQIENYDIWMLPLRNEVITESTATSETSDLASLYQQLAYQSYYNNMYGGGYYGSGSYGYNSYTNYYNYMMMAQYYASASNSSTATTQTMVDFHRFYKGYLNGPGTTSGRKPYIRIAYAVPKE